MMDPAPVIRLTFHLPQNISGISILDRPCRFKMARPTAHPKMGIMGDFFIMRQMTLTAVSQGLFGMAKLSGVGMTDQTRDPGVGGCGIIGNINQGCNGGFFCALFQGMAVKTKSRDVLG